MLIEELILRGLLSFGPDASAMAMRPLNVLIGPNGSGKSNVIEAIDLLRSSATKLTAPMRGPGAAMVTDWIWKGLGGGRATVGAVVRLSDASKTVNHQIRFAERSARFELVDEVIEPCGSVSESGSEFFYRYQSGRPLIVLANGDRRELRREDIAVDDSILAQRRDPDQYPELSYLSDCYRRIRIYRDWSFGRSSVFRIPQAADMPGDRLEEDFSNLGLFLNHLRGFPSVKHQMVSHLRDLYEGLDDFDIRIKGGAVEVFLTEGDFAIPATRLSDGTLRYLCLLAVLCDPSPPPLICIEEPELGLHPDLLPKLADLMAEASERTQLVVTTHSDMLVDAMTDRPESIVVMEKHSGRTVSRRLDRDAELTEWLTNYRLGELWTRGQIGGTRW